jgi:hypothetical protein
VDDFHAGTSPVEPFTIEMLPDLSAKLTELCHLENMTKLKATRHDAVIAKLNLDEVCLNLLVVKIMGSETSF